MNDVMFSFFFSYLIGSIPFSVIAAKYFLKQDIRKVGSGNIGVSNAYRAGGFLFSFAVALVDISKSIIVLKFIWPAYLPVTLGVFAVCIGQMFPIMLNFKGGKGIACYIGALIALNPIVGSIIGIGWLAITKITNMPFVSSMAVLAASLFFVTLDGYILLTMLMIIVRHKSNIMEFLSTRFGISVEKKRSKNKKC